MIQRKKIKLFKILKKRFTLFGKRIGRKAKYNNKRALYKKRESIRLRQERKIKRLIQKGKAYENFLLRV
jgi:hypothetical protein